MDRLFVYLSLLCCILIVRCNVNNDSINPSIVIIKAERKVDISSHLVKSASSLTVENTGKVAVKSFLYSIEPSLQKYLSFIGASIKDDDNKLTVSKTAVDGHGDKEFWRINLPSSLAAGKSVQVDVDSVYAHALAPFPTKIKQSEKQLVVFTGNVFLYSPYKITSQTTTVNLASSSIESYSKSPKPVSQSEKTVTYGPYEAREPFTEAELRVHAENNNPFLTVTHLERVIELSHWGNIAVEENIQMRHSGADLSGPFSRYDYQRTQDAGASIKSFKVGTV
ncbi:OST1 [Mytilus coruscus]|uniref:Dolichyl-diphosphooligosaccharide--protein glycosyltransferase subunit 1 n=1 Tax=Mytilus coruscus TaxID=42192 RepID=A0A6J8DTP2_MYTCO|nr:OST1 [Mytilus coruscus]